MFDPIFPGMDPFIEGQRWREFHGQMIGRIQNELARLLAPQYDVIQENYIHLMIPDVYIAKARPDTEPLAYSTARIAEATRDIPLTITDEDFPPHIEIYDHRGRLVTILELLSPTNKETHFDRYIEKRAAIFQSKVHLVEIDLLRGGRRLEPHMPSEGYCVLLARWQNNTLRRGKLFEIGLRDALPVIPVPLHAQDPDIPLDLALLFRDLYIAARHRLYLDYSSPPAVPFSDADAAWVNQLLKEAHVL